MINKYTTRLIKGSNYTLSSTTQLESLLSSFNRSGYSISSWNTKPDGSGYTIDLGSTIKISGDIEIYAQWRHEGYEMGDIEYYENYPESFHIITETSNPIIDTDGNRIIYR